MDVVCMSSLGDGVEKEHVCASPGLSSHLALGNQGKIARDIGKEFLPF